MDVQSTGPNILVTGGAGFIGANLVRMLLDHGYTVTVLDDLSTGKADYLDGLGIKLVDGSILDLDLVSSLMEASYHVVHLAAQAGVPDSLVDPQHNFEINVRGTLNLLETARRQMDKSTQVRDSGPWQPFRRKFVFASSNATLGRQGPPASEDKAPLPISPYGASKLAGEAYCLAYQASWGLGTVALRFGNVYGPLSIHKDSVVSKFCKDISENRRIVVYGDGTQTRDFVYVQDLCDAIVRSLESEVSGEVFQIATGVETSIGELADMITRIAGREPTIEYSPARPGDVDKSFSHVAKASQYLGWTARTDLHTGLSLTWEWFSSRTQ